MTRNHEGMSCVGANVFATKVNGHARPKTVNTPSWNRRDSNPSPSLAQYEKSGPGHKGRFSVDSRRAIVMTSPYVLPANKS